MFQSQFSQAGRRIQMTPFRLEDMNGFNVFLNVAIDADQLSFQRLNLVFHNQNPEAEQAGQGCPEN